MREDLRTVGFSKTPATLELEVRRDGSSAVEFV